MGKKKKPIYRIVVADARSPRDGRFIEEVGFYDPNTEPMTIQYKEDKIKYWLNSGAQPTNTVRSLLKREGFLYKIRMIKRNLAPENIENEMQKFNEAKKSKHEREIAKKTRRKQNKTKIKSEKKEGEEAKK
jgi:small subunit ribosomal protein S16